MFSLVVGLLHFVGRTYLKHVLKNDESASFRLKDCEFKRLERKVSEKLSSFGHENLKVALVGSFC